MFKRLQKITNMQITDTDWLKMDEAILSTLQFLANPDICHMLVVCILKFLNPSWGGPIELFLVPASAPRLV